MDSRAAPPASRVSLELDVPYGPDKKLFAGHRIGGPRPNRGRRHHGLVHQPEPARRPSRLGRSEDRRAREEAGQSGRAARRPRRAPSTPPCALRRTQSRRRRSPRMRPATSPEKWAARNSSRRKRSRSSARKTTTASTSGNRLLRDRRRHVRQRPAKDTTTPSLALTNVGGASTKNDLTGTVQPVSGMYAPTGWKMGKSRITGGGWVQLDALDYDAPLKGTVRVATPKGTIGGAFTAEVCKKK